MPAESARSATRRSPPDPGAGPRAARARWGRSMPPTRRPSAAGASSTSTTCCPTPLARSTRTRPSPRCSAGGSATCSSTRCRTSTRSRWPCWKPGAGDRTDLCVVGDPNQAIYEWNGAEPGWLQELAVHHPGATIVRLTRNYRSSPEVLAVATDVLRTLDTAPAAPGAAGPNVMTVIDVEATRPSGPAVTVHDFADELSEAAAIAALIRDEHQPGRRWSSFGVLVRTHAQVPVIERALRDAGVPVRARGGQPLLANPDMPRRAGRRRRPTRARRATGVPGRPHRRPRRRHRGPPAGHPRRLGAPVLDRRPGRQRGVLPGVAGDGLPGRRRPLPPTPSSW